MSAETIATYGPVFIAFVILIPAILFLPAMLFELRPFARFGRAGQAGQARKVGSAQEPRE